MKTPKSRRLLENRSPVSRGFTLVELLVVVAIILVLAALTFGFAKFGRQRAQAARCVNNVKQLCAVQMGIVEDTGGYFCTPGWTEIDGKKRGFAMHFTVFLNDSLNYKDKWSTLNARVTDVDILNCPTAYAKARTKMEEVNGPARWNTYALSARIGVAQGQTSEQGNGSYIDGAQRPEQLASPGLTVCVSEGALNKNGRYKTSFGPSSSRPSEGGMSEHHSGSFHVGYMDGHVERHTMETFPYEGNTLPGGRTVDLKWNPKDENDRHWSIVWRGQPSRREVPDPQ